MQSADPGEFVFLVRLLRGMEWCAICTCSGFAFLERVVFSSEDIFCLLLSMDEIRRWLITCFTDV